MTRDPFSTAQGRTAAWSRRAFLKRGGIAAMGITYCSIGIQRADAELSTAPEDAPHIHNMLVVGQDTIFLSHLPMFQGMNLPQTDFTSPHRYQVILQVGFTQDGKSIQDVYAQDRRQNPHVKMYTLSPEHFVLSRLFTPAPQQPMLNTFRAMVFRGHLERGGQQIAGLANVLVHVKKVIHARKFEPTAAKPDKLTYLLFGRGQELFLAHRITTPPDFDHILSVEVNDNPLTDEDLTWGVELVLLDRANVVSQRLKEKETVSGRGHMTGAQQFVPLRIHAGVEIYFEEGELFIPPTFEPTPEEKNAGFEVG
jgi:hypothetical protein